MSNKLFGFFKGLGSNASQEEEDRMQQEHARSQDTAVATEEPEEESSISDAMVDFCVTALQTILTAAEFEGTATYKRKRGNKLFLEIEDAGEDVGRLIGREGHTLDCLQILVRASFFQQFDAPLRLIIDAGGYHDKKQKNFRQKANNAANRVKQYGKSVALEPMNAADRRSIHMMFQDSDDIQTESEGAGRDRHVVLIKRG